MREKIIEIILENYQESATDENKKKYDLPKAKQVADAICDLIKSELPEKKIDFKNWTPKNRKDAKHKSFNRGFNACCNQIKKIL